MLSKPTLTLKYLIFFQFNLTKQIIINSIRNKINKMDHTITMGTNTKSLFSNMHQFL